MQKMVVKTLDYFSHNPAHDLKYLGLDFLNWTNTRLPVK